jgi:Domain of unknown function (DUF4263)
MSEENEQTYHFGRRTDRTYTSAPFGNGKLKYVTKVIDSPDAAHFAQVETELVIRRTGAERKEIKAVVTVDERGIKTLTIQRFSRRGDPNTRLHFSFVGDEIDALIEFVMAIKAMPLDGKNRYLSDDEVRLLVLSSAQKLRMLNDDPDLIAQVVENTHSLKRDVSALNYRREQLATFRRLMEENAEEATWQAFFERNHWIFGYGLSFQFLGPAYEQKLEQMVRGFDVTGRGKRMDALMRTMGRLSSLCFVEIKRPDTDLLGDEYRVGAWPPSEDVSGAVAQVQATVQAAMAAIREKLEPTDAEGWQTGEAFYNYEPRSYLVVGNLGQFVDGGRVNQNQLRSFELYRRNTWRPEIITFDELYERAKFIVGDSVPVEKASDVDDIPF